MRAARLGLLLGLLSAGCSTRACRDGTLLLSLSFEGGAAGADSARITVSGAGAAAKVSTVLGPLPASGTVEVTFPGGYPAGQTITVQVEALQGGSAVASGSARVVLTAGCSSQSMRVSGPSADGAADGDPGGAVDATSPCDGGLVSCAGLCVDLSSSAVNCGRCGHDCGGAAAKCTGGVCQAAMLIAGQRRPAFDVDGTNLYYAIGNALQSCPSNDCRVPVQLAKVEYPINQVLSGKTNVFFTSYFGHNLDDTLFACDKAMGCGVPTTIQDGGDKGFMGGVVASGDDVYAGYSWFLLQAHCGAPGVCGSVQTLNLPGPNYALALAASAEGIYYIEQPTGLLRRCGAVGNCVPFTVFAGPLKMLHPSGGLGDQFNLLAVASGTLYVLDSGHGSSGHDGKILTCPAGGCGALRELARGQWFPVLHVADADGVYWVNAGNGTGVGEINACLGPSCLGGPRTLAAQQPSISVLHTDAHFVYWATDTQIWRVAKP